MNTGTLFVPYRMFDGLHVPEGLAQYQQLTWSAKGIWARLNRYAGSRGVAWPSQSTLAEECGLSRRCVQRALSELEEQRFIQDLGKRHRNTMWGFLWHPAFEASNVRTSTNGKASYRRTLSTEPAESPEPESSSVNMTHDSASNRRRESVISTPESVPPHTPLHEACHDMSHVLDSPLTPQGGQSNLNSHAPEPEEPIPRQAMKLLQELFVPGKPGELEYADLTDLMDEHTAEVVLRELKFIRDNRPTVRRRGVIPYICKCLKERRSTQNADNSESGNWR